MKISVEFDQMDIPFDMQFGDWLPASPGEPKAVLFVPQDLPPEQQAQAQENIGASTYYHTKREEIGVSHENINTAYIWGLYDALMAEYPDNVQKKEHTNNDGAFTNYEYVISTGEYSTEGLYATAYGCDPHIKKPKYLVLSGIHGTERKTTLSTYRFVRDVLSGHNVPPAFLEGAVLSVMPIGTPSAFDAFTRQSGEAVDINRNFDWNWVEDDRTDENGNAYTYGESAASEKETQAITNWLTANNDAELFIDFHNSGQLNEKVVVLSLPDNSISDMARKVALRGVDRVIPFWRDVIGYPTTVVAKGRTDTDGDGNKIEERDVIFSYSATTEGAGMAFAYAQGVLGIRSIGIEAVVYYGDYYEYKANETSYQPEVIAMGAEALGNILIEFYAQSCEVIAMSNVDSKLDILIESTNSGFHTESGVYEVSADIGSVTSIKIPCSSGAKILTFQADATVTGSDGYTTYERITTQTSASNGVKWVVGVMGNCLTQIGKNASRGYMSAMQEVQTSATTTKYQPGDGAVNCTNTDGFKFSAYGIKAGSYNWTAYYWND